MASFFCFVAYLLSRREGGGGALPFFREAGAGDRPERARPKEKKFCKFGLKFVCLRFKSCIDGTKNFVEC